MTDVKSKIPFAEKPGETRAKPCPICGKSAAFANRPFCSKRCSDIDLHRWLGGVYAIPVAAAVDADGDALDAASG